MTGIQFITDDKGRKTAAVIDLKKHKRYRKLLRWARVRVAQRGAKPYLRTVPGQPPEKAHAGYRSRSTICRPFPDGQIDRAFARIRQPSESPLALQVILEQREEVHIVLN